MTVGTRSSWLAIGLAAILIVLLVYAWADGGREPLHEIAEPVAVPAMPAEGGK